MRIRTPPTPSSRGLISLTSRPPCAPDTGLECIFVKVNPHDPSSTCPDPKTLPTLTFAMGGHNFELAGDDLLIKVTVLGQSMCMSTVMGFPGLPTSIGAILGDVFLRRYYSVFDAGQARVGLALAVQLLGLGARVD